MKWFLIINFLFLHACSNLPANIKNPPKANIQLQQVLNNRETYQKTPVRWGGTIIEVNNKTDSTTMEIQSYPLDYYGRPKINQPAQGRFITVSKLFLDPDIYKNGSEITVAGTIQGQEEKQIGKKAITLPVIAIDSHHKWPIRYNYYDPYDYSSRYYGNYYGSYSPYIGYRSRYRFFGCY